MWPEGSGIKVKNGLRLKPMTKVATGRWKEGRGRGGGGVCNLICLLQTLAKPLQLPAEAEAVADAVAATRICQYTHSPPSIQPPCRRCKWKWLGRLRPLRNFNDVQFKLFEIQKQRKVCFALCCAPKFHYKRATGQEREEELGMRYIDWQIGKGAREG